MIFNHITSRGRGRVSFVLHCYQTERRVGILTVDVVDVVDSDLLVINLLPPQRQFISNTVSKRQRLGNPGMTTQ